MITVCLALAALLQVNVESSQFKVYLDGEQVGTEEFAVNRQGSGYLAHGRTRLEINGEDVDVESRMELDAQLRPVAYEYRSDGQVLSVHVGDPLTEVSFEPAEGGEGMTYNIRFPAGGMIVDDNFFHHYLLLLYRVGPEGGSIPVFVPQQATLGRIRVEASGEDTFSVTTENLRLRATTDPAGRLIRLESDDASVVIRR